MPVLDICEGDGDERPACPLLVSKPGFASPELQFWALQATRLTRLKEAGAVFTYPDALRVAEWAALDAAMLARIEAENEGQQEKQSEAVENAMAARLTAAKNRGRRA